MKAMYWLKQYACNYTRRLIRYQIRLCANLSEVEESLTCPNVAEKEINPVTVKEVWRKNLWDAWDS